jgi:hypothetical protein
VHWPIRETVFARGCTSNMLAFARAAMVICVASLASSIASAHEMGVSETPEATQVRISPAQMTTVMDVASEHPCAALALIRILYGDSNATAGILLLDSLPSAAAIALLLDGSGVGTGRDISAALYENPYSDAAYLAKISWHSITLGSSALLVTFRAELVGRVSGSVVQGHVLESPMAILFSAGQIALLRSPERTF